jgi:catechol 2,3-dioxygenase-like lactoylglutathione lyase family enzyme
MVPDRAEAEAWYGRVLGLRRVAGLEVWATVNGPLMLGTADGGIKLAMFTGQTGKNRSTIAFGVRGREFLDWQNHLNQILEGSPRVVDHGLAWSMYFADPWGNPFEITSCDYDWLAGQIKT